MCQIACQLYFNSLKQFERETRDMIKGGNYSAIGFNILCYFYQKKIKTIAIGDLFKFCSNYSHCFQFCFCTSKPGFFYE